MAKADTIAGRASDREWNGPKPHRHCTVSDLAMASGVRYPAREVVGRLRDVWELTRA
jgi:hypothetical protein